MDERSIGFIQGLAYATALVKRYELNATEIIKESGFKVDEIIEHAGEHDLILLELATYCEICKDRLTAKDVSLSNLVNEDGENHCEYSLSCRCGHIDVNKNEWGHYNEEDKQNLFEELFNLIEV